VYTLPEGYAFLLAVAVAVISSLLVLTFGYRSKSVARWLLWFFVGLLVWIASQLLIVVRRAFGPEWPRWLADLGVPPLDLLGPYVGSTMTLVMLVLFALEYTGKEHLATRRVGVLISIVPAIAIVAAVFNGHHTLFWASFRQVNDLDGWVWVDGPLLVVHQFYSYGLAVVAIVLLTRLFVKSRTVYRDQAIAVAVAVATPLVANVLYFGGVVAVDLTEIGLLVSGVALLIAVARYELADLMPIARATVLENIDDGVVVVDPNDRVVDFNGPAGDLLGIDERVIGSDARDAFDRIADTYDELGQATQASAETTIEGDHDRRFLNVTVSAVSDRRGTTVGRVYLLRDVTERRKREWELQRKNERLDQFASVVSHDLRNPLTVTSQYIELTRETGNLDHLDDAKNGVERMASLIDDTLTLARKGETISDPAPVELGDVVEAAWRNVETSGATLDNRLAATVEGDRDRLIQLFENFFRNSVEHGSTGSRPAADDSVEHGGANPRSQTAQDDISYGTDDAEADRLIESTADSDPSATGRSDGPTDRDRLTVRVGPLDALDGVETERGFYVADNGPGLSECDPSDVLEAGYTTQSEGTGLGLAIVEQIVEAHGWSLAVDEEYDDGVRFLITGTD